MFLVRRRPYSSHSFSRFYVVNWKYLRSQINWFSRRGNWRIIFDSVNPVKTWFDAADLLTSGDVSLFPSHPNVHDVRIVVMNWWHVVAQHIHGTGGKTPSSVSPFQANLRALKHWHDKWLWSVWKHYGFYDQRELFLYPLPKKNLFIWWNYGYFRHLYQWQQAAIKRVIFSLAASK